MKSIELKNYQCFKNSGIIPFQDITFFVGENDCGKSTILHAIDFFFNNITVSEDLFYKNNEFTENEIEIIVTFNNNMATNLFPENYIINNEIKTKRVVKRVQNIIDDSYQCYISILEDERLNNYDTLKAPELKELLHSYSLSYANAEEAKKQLREFIQSQKSILPRISKWTPVKYSIINQFLPIFEYYNTNDYGNPLKFVNNTLKSVYESFFYDFQPDSTKTLKTQFKTLKESIIDELNQKINNELKNKIREKNSKIKNITGDFSIEFANGFNLINIFVDFGNGERNINYIGEGSRKRLFLAITEWDKEIRQRTQMRKIIRGYDEPDTSLHYQAQKELYFILNEMITNSDLNIQPIVCTHSVSMIDRARPKYINHVIFHNNESSIDYLKGEEDIDIREFLNKVFEIGGVNNSAIFFEKCFLIVEGDTEYNALPIIYKKISDKSLSEDGIVLINIEGNGAWKSFLKLLSRNKSKKTLLFLDRDIETEPTQNLSKEVIIDEIGFDEDFYSNNVILVGNKEFEDVFSDELLAKTLNHHFPKEFPDLWIVSEISILRKEKKFSEALLKLVNQYYYNHKIKKPRLKKPIFGKTVAEVINVDEINKISAIQSLSKRIKAIIN